MKGYEGIEKDIWNAIRGLTSGVLTSLICGMLSSNSYELIFNGEKYEITQGGPDPQWTILFVVFIFLLIWAIIEGATALMLLIKKRFAFGHIGHVRMTNLVRALAVAKDSTTQLYLMLYGDNGEAKVDLMPLHIRELSEIVVLLHKNFLPHEKENRRIINARLRNSKKASSNSIAVNTPVYELAGMVCILKKIVSDIINRGDKDILGKEKCAGLYEIERKIEELGDLVSRIMKE